MFGGISGGRHQRRRDDCAAKPSIHGEEVTFGAALCKENDIIVSALSRIATLRTCLWGLRTVSNLAIPHAGPRPLPSRSGCSGVGVSETARSTDFLCGGSTGERTDNASSYR
jgi:hypothetical protein